MTSIIFIIGLMLGFLVVSCVGVIFMTPKYITPVPEMIEAAKQRENVLFQGGHTRTKSTGNSKVSTVAFGEDDALGDKHASDMVWQHYFSRFDESF
jgi:hypothetical protein